MSIAQYIICLVYVIDDKCFITKQLKRKAALQSRKKGVRWEKIIYSSIFEEARCLGLEQTVVAVQSNHIAVMALYIYIRLSIAVQTDDC